MSEDIHPLEKELQEKIVAMTEESKARREALIRQAAEEGTYYPGGVNMTSFFREIRALQEELAANKGPVEVVEPVIEEVEEVTAEVEDSPVEAPVEEPEAETPEVESTEPVEEPKVEEPVEEPKPKRTPRKKPE